MVLVIKKRTWTFGLCSIYILHNTILVNSFGTDKNKGSLNDSSKIFQKSYNFEDFFWTGSGDGPVGEDILNNITNSHTILIHPSSLETWKTTTVFHTTTILFATVYPDARGCFEHECVPEISPVQTGSVDFSLSTYLPPNASEIRPSNTVTNVHTTTLSWPHIFVKKNKTDDNSQEAVSHTYVTPKLSTNKIHLDDEYKGNGIGENYFPQTTVFPDIFPDQKYWLLTILKDDKYLPKIDLKLTEKKLSTLYQKAFYRGHNKFLGENDLVDQKDPKLLQLVKIHIFNTTQIGNDLGIIYTVAVNGNPIPANTAANDMRLLTTHEIIAELGRPILTKAEPYVKTIVPFGARVRGKTRDTWLLIGSVIAAILLLLLLVALFVLILSKSQSRKNSAKTSAQIEEEKGNSNLGYDDDDTNDALNVDTSVREEQKILQTKKSTELKMRSECLENKNELNNDEKQTNSTSSSCSGSSEASLVRIRNQKIKKDVEDKPKPKPRARDRKIQSSDSRNISNRRDQVFSAGSAISQNTFDGSVIEECCSSHLIKSPTSYLSMPSVKAFPKATKIPDPLNKILEPTVIRHLDADSDSPREYSNVQNRQVEVEIEQVCEVKNKFVRGKTMTRHASLEGDDPGFIGPVVWNRHCQKIMTKENVTLNEEEIEYENVNVGKMRRRFNELLDDALSMFGSKNGSPEGSDAEPVRQLDNRIHSAVIRPAGVTAEESTSCRPNTTGSKRPQSSLVTGPKGAWETPSCSTLARPLSAGFFQDTSPTIDKRFIYANSELSPNDPAIPLIAAIKNELKKFDGSPSTES